MPAKNRVAVPCAQCGTYTEKTQSQIRNAKHNFCSQHCKSAWLKAHPRTRTTVQCAYCHKEIERHLYQVKARDNHFCDQECMAKYFKTLTGVDAPCYKRVNVQCEMCGKDIQKPPGRIKRNKHNFCSQVCKHRYKSENYTGPNSSNWRGGAAKFYGPNWKSQSRQARKRDGYRCQLCGKSQKDNKRALDVHHKIPFKKFNYIPDKNENYLQANDLDNLISLCIACHAQTEIENRTST